MTSYLVNVPVADLRREPIASLGNYSQDPLQESQLLFGEKVQVLEEKNGWLRIEALEQQKCHKDGSWGGYPGWVKADEIVMTHQDIEPNLVVHDLWAEIKDEKTGNTVNWVTFGTLLKGISCQKGEWLVMLPDGRRGVVRASPVRPLLLSLHDLRNSLVNLGKNFLGFPYLWGGRSAFRKDDEHSGNLTSVDCSGLLNLLYRVHNINIPRDAHDQFLKCQKINPIDLKAGDLIFMASKSKPDRMTHVMMYNGNNSLLESTAASNSVRIISFKDRIGKSLMEMRVGHSNDGHNFYFGTFI